MPSFLKDLRRMSKSSFRSSSNKSDNSKDTPSNQSSSTVESGDPGSTTPPSTVPSDQSSSGVPSLNNGGAPAPPRRPTVQQNRNSRYSLLVRRFQGSDLHSVPPLSHAAPVVFDRMLTVKQNASSSALSASPSGGRQLPTSPYAPRVISISDNSWVSGAGPRYCGARH